MNRIQERLLSWKQSSNNLGFRIVLAFWNSGKHDFEINILRKGKKGGQTK